MKKNLLSLALVLLAGTLFSQNPLPTGSSQFNAGVGLSNSGIPVYVGFDYGLMRDITIGTEFSFRGYNENWHNNNYNHSILGISANANYHFNALFNISPRWDLYAGPNIGFYVWSSPDGYLGNNNSRLGVGGQFGTRYFLTNKFGLNLEFGGGNAFSGGKFGITIRM